MQLKFIQQKWGQCLFYVLANVFDDINIIPADKLGGYHMDARRITELKTNKTFSVIYHSLVPNYLKPISDPLVFKSQKPNTDYYNIYIVSVPGSLPKTFHCLLVVVDCMDDTLIVFDPMSAEGKKMSAQQFLQTNSVYEIETFCSYDDGGQIFFNKQFLNHLN